MRRKRLTVMNRSAGRTTTGHAPSATNICRPAPTPVCSTRLPSTRSKCADPARLAFLNRVCANNIDQPVGSVVYTQCLNQRGGIECDFTVNRIAEERFLIITGTAFGQHDISWLSLNMPEDGSVSIEDVGSSYACIGLWGPKARTILEKVTNDDVSNAGFPYMTSKRISVGDIPVIASRVTYVGELGWEFYCPMEYGLRLWDTLWEAGAPEGMVAGGYKAIETPAPRKGLPLLERRDQPGLHSL